MTYSMIKTAGMIMDQQDDPGIGWDEIGGFWPEYLDEPSIGTTMTKVACVAQFDDGSHKYPTDTPENTLASSMYFLRFGMNYMEDMDQITKIATDLKAYRLIHNVQLPDGFMDYVMSREWDEPEDVMHTYADSEENLPTTTPELTQQSISVFEKNASLWNSESRYWIAQSLKEAADFHGINSHIKEASYSGVSDHVGGAIQLRLNAMESMARQIKAQAGDAFDQSFFDSYQTAIGSVFDSEDDPVKIASLIEELDINYGLDDGWDTMYPNPLDSVFVGVNPYAGFTKSASYDGVDFDGLRGDLDGYIVDAIAENPSVVIPTLPAPQREIVDSYLGNKRK